MTGDPIDPRDYDETVRNRQAMKQEALNNYHDPICAGYAALLASCPEAAFIDNLNDYDDTEQDYDDIRPY